MAGRFYQEAVVDWESATVIGFVHTRSHTGASKHSIRTSQLRQSFGAGVFAELSETAEKAQLDRVLRIGNSSTATYKFVERLHCRLHTFSNPDETVDIIGDRLPHLCVTRCLD